MEASKSPQCLVDGVGDAGTVPVFHGVPMDGEWVNFGLCGEAPRRKSPGTGELPM